MEIVGVKQQLWAWGRNEEPLKWLTKNKKTIVPCKIKTSWQVQQVIANKQQITLLTKHGQVYQMKAGTWRRVPQLTGIVKIACGDQHYVALDSQGRSFAWGVGTSGCLGNYSFKDLQKPSAVMEQFLMEDVICGPCCTFFITRSNEVYACGSNNFGQLGVNSNKQYCLPHLVDTKGMVVIKIAAGNQHTLFLTKQGNIYACGSGKQGQLGLKSSDEDCSSTTLQKIVIKQKFVDIDASNFSCAVSKKGCVYIWGTSSFAKYNVPTAFTKQSNNFSKAVAGNDCCYGLTTDGEVWVWGKNTQGQLGVGDNHSRGRPFPLMKLEAKIVDNIFVGKAMAFCLVSAQKHEKVFKRQCCSGQHHRLRSKQNRSVNRSVISKGSKSPRSKISSAMGQIKDSRKRNKRKPLVQKLNITNMDDRAASCNFSINKSCPDEPCGSFPVTGHPKKQNNLSLTIKQNNAFVDRFRTGTPEPTNILNNLNARMMHEQLAQCLRQKNRMAQQIKQKDFIIQDITNKIRLLEDAIAERQKLDVSRQFNANTQEFQRKQKMYLREIEHLNHIIEGMMRRQRLHVQKNGSVDAETQNYSQLRSLSRQQQMDSRLASVLKEEVLTLQAQILKLTQDHQLVLKENRNLIEQLTEKLQEMEKLLAQKDHTILLLRKGDKVQVYPRLTTQERMHIKSVQQPVSHNTSFQHNLSLQQGSPIKELRKPLAPMNIDVEKTIQKIEQNRRRISHSANKLIHILDMSS